MKNILFIIALFLCTKSFAQSSEIKLNYSPSGILEFPTGTTKGIILPIVSTLPASPTNGTLLMDKNDLKVKAYQNNAWLNLSDAGSIQNVTLNTATETGTNGIIIGSTTTTANGVLVLESSNKALVLPTIANPHTTVKSPYAGMMCYDSVSKSVAVFDGLVWNYWK